MPPHPLDGDEFDVFEGLSHLKDHSRVSAKNNLPRFQPKRKNLCSNDRMSFEDANSASKTYLSVLRYIIDTFGMHSDEERLWGACFPHVFMSVAQTI